MAPCDVTEGVDISGSELTDPTATNQQRSPRANPKASAFSRKERQTKDKYIFSRRLETEG